MVKKQNTGIHSVSSLISSVTILNLSREVDNLKRKHKETCQMAAKSILHALDYKDHYTYGHSTRVAYYSLILGRNLKFTSEEMYDLELAALFHDIGKIGIPDSILLKPAPLSEAEAKVMETHPVKSAEILKDFHDFDNIALYIRHHHEQFNGKGYPDGLAGDRIPLFSRILLLSDTFDAMTSSRPYRKGLSKEQAFEELEKYSGIQFDPELANLFINSINKEISKDEDFFYLKVVGEQFKKAA